MTSSKKVMPAIALSLFAIAAQGFAAEKPSPEGHLNPKACGSNLNTSMSARMNGSCGLMIGADLLIWNVDQDGMLYAVQDATQTTANAITSAKGQYVDPSWELGFRINAGYQLPQDGWDLNAAFTYIKSNTTGSVSQPGDSSIASIFPSLGQSNISNHSAEINSGHFDDAVFDRAYSAKSKSNIKTFLFDLELGKEYSPQNSPWFSIRPHAGLRYTSIDQDWNTAYLRDLDAAAVTRNNLATVFSETVSLSQNSWGLGVRAGIDAEFGIKAGFGAYGKLAASVLYSEFDNKSTETLTESLDLANDPDSFVFTTKGSDNAGKLATDLEFGLMYERMFSDNRYGLTVQLGWEHHLFVNHNRMMKSSREDRSGAFDQNHGDLAFHGFKLGAKLDF